MLKHAFTLIRLLTAIVMTIILVISLLTTSFPPLTVEVLGAQTDVSYSNALLSNLPTLTTISDPQRIPTSTGEVSQPSITADHAIVIDRATKTILYQKDIDSPALPASTTKIVTALVAMETFSFEEILTVPWNIASEAGGSSMGLEPGDSLSVESLLKGLLINSGNDAAYTLAFHHPYGVTGMVADMNRLAQKLSLENTNFMNPYGFDHTYHYTSARDLALITDYALENPFFADITSTRSTQVKSQLGTYTLQNTNELLGTVSGVTGVKTGWTALAQGVLVTTTTRNNHEIITVVMKSPQREIDNQTLIDWAYASYIW